MPSGSSLVGRVARVTATAAGLGALVAALGAGVIADGFMRRQEDRRLNDAARVLAQESAGLDRVRAGRAADDEVVEISHTEMRIALFDRDGRVGGDRRLPGPAATSSCTTDLRQRRCTRWSADRAVVVAADRAFVADYRRFFLGAAAIAVVLATLLGALLSARAARWAADPLTRLAGAVRGFAIEQPRWSDLEEAYACQEVDALRTALLDLVGRLERALGRSRQFSADAAHELRTPLTTVRAELELLGEAAIDAPTRGAIERACTTLVALQQLLDRLLVLASPAQKGVPRAAVALVDVVHGALQALSPAVRERVVVEERVDGTVRGDETLLGAMISNALDNALKFSSGPVVVTVGEHGAEVIVDITDEGDGIPEAEREQVFLPFHRAARARASNVAGYGIGLALIAHVVEAHGGNVGFVASLRGANLRISLPGWRSATDAVSAGFVA